MELRIDAKTVPNFFILGAAKCGTTSLHHYLRQHDNVFMPYAKELYFFIKGDFESELSEYLSYFEGAKSKAIGEATPSYFRRPDVVIPRMKRFYGDSLHESPTAPRFILLFRDPVKRAFSNYMHNVRLGRESRTFERALSEEDDDLQDSRRRWRSYFHDGKYADLLEQWQEEFPPERFLILLTKELGTAPKTLVRRAFDFIGVDPSYSVDANKRLNRGGGAFRSRTVRDFLGSPPSFIHRMVTTLFSKPTRRAIRQFINRLNSEPADNSTTLDPETEATLRRRYCPSIRKLETMLDRDLSAWLPSDES